jgi:hypothetical protein
MAFGERSERSGSFIAPSTMWSSIAMLEKANSRSQADFISPGSALSSRQTGRASDPSSGDASSNHRVLQGIAGCANAVEQAVRNRWGELIATG